jgi:hypothetical protein
VSRRGIGAPSVAESEEIKDENNGVGYRIAQLLFLMNIRRALAASGRALWRRAINNAQLEAACHQRPDAKPSQPAWEAFVRFQESLAMRKNSALRRAGRYTGGDGKIVS